MDLKDLELFDKGHRALIYVGFFKGKKIAVKKSKLGAAGNTVKNEAKWLKILNKYNIGPKLIDSGDNYIVYEFVEGEFLPDFVSKGVKIDKVLKDVLNQCRVLDKLEVNKEEMTHPYKHILIDKKFNAVMIDFERCKKSSKPKNVTQFCQYLTSSSFKEIYNLKVDKDKLILLLKEYKKDMSCKNYKKIIKFIFS